MKTKEKKLYRSSKNKIIFGVIGGLGEYFDVDPVLLRVFYIFISVFTGILPGVIAYMLISLVMPKDNKVIYIEKEENINESK